MADSACWASLRSAQPTIYTSCLFVGWAERSEAQHSSPLTIVRTRIIYTKRPLRRQYPLPDISMN